MRKYREVAATYLKTQLTWRADTIFQVITTISKVIFAYILWSVIFDSNKVVSGFTFSSMLSYYIISAFLGQLEQSSEISFEMSGKIRNGQFSRYMVLPMNIEHYYLWMEAGKISFSILFHLVTVVAMVFLCRIPFVLTKAPFMIVAAILMEILGLVFMAQLNYYLGLLTFKYDDIGTFLMIKNNLMAVITGSIIPLVLLPEFVIRWMRVFPFYYVTYLPSMLLIGRCQNEAVLGLVVLAGWCIGLELLNQWTYRRYRVKFDGVGI